jgi:hypothetical protein
MAGNKCDVCSKEPTVGVACSSMGPISFAYYADCIVPKVMALIALIR